MSTTTKWKDNSRICSFPVLQLSCEMAYWVKYLRRACVSLMHCTSKMSVSYVVNTVLPTTTTHMLVVCFFFGSAVNSLREKLQFWYVTWKSLVCYTILTRIKNVVVVVCFLLHSYSSKTPIKQSYDKFTQTPFVVVVNFSCAFFFLSSFYSYCQSTSSTRITILGTFNLHGFFHHILI